MQLSSIKSSTARKCLFPNHWKREQVGEEARKYFFGKQGKKKQIEGISGD